MFTVKVTPEKSLTLTEGRSGKPMSAKMTVPPSFLCPPDLPQEKCSVLVTGRVVSDQTTLMCGEGSNIQQLVVKSITR